MTRKRAFFTAVCAGVAGALAFLIAVGSFLGQISEEIVVNAANFSADPPAPLGQISTALAIFILFVSVTIALFSAGILRAVTIGVVSTATIIASQLLKHEWLERPVLTDSVATNSFPSGHMTVALTLSAAVIWAVPARLRTITAMVSVLFSGTVSWQLLEYGWHRPSDLLGAQALVVCLFSLAAWLGPRTKQIRVKATHNFSQSNRVLGTIYSSFGLICVSSGLLLLLISAVITNEQFVLVSAQITLLGSTVVATRFLERLGGTPVLNAKKKSFVTPE